MKAKLLAATAAVLLFATPAIAQDSTGTTESGTNSNTGAGDSGATQLQVPGTTDSQNNATGTDTTTTTGTQNDTSGTDLNTGTNAQTDTTTTGQTGTGTAAGTDAQTDTGTAAGTSTDTNANTATTTGTTTTTAGTADNQQMIQQMSQVTSAPDFVNFAAMSDMFEIQSGEFASNNLKGKMANELAKMIVKDHKESSRQMMDIAQTANLNIQPQTELGQRHQQLLDELKNAAEEPGATTSSTSSANNATAGDGVVSTDGQPTVDQVFARQQVQAHEEGVALFQAYAQNGDNPELKAFAEKGLPVLQEHLKMAQDLVKAQDELIQESQTQQ